MSRRWRAPAVLALAAAVRMLTWGVVFQSGVVMLLADSDPHYHVLRAERILRDAPGAPWRDPSLDWPRGAELLWPPLFDELLAAMGWIHAGPAAPRDEIARVAAFLPLVLGLVSVAGVWALARRLLGPRRGSIAALLVAVLPAHAAFTALGRPDQHAAELALFPWMLFLVHGAATRARWRVVDGLGLAGIVTVAFWTWQGSAVLLAPPLLAAAAMFVWVPEGDGARRAARGVVTAGLGGALLLAATLAAFGPPGVLLRPATAGVNGLHVAICGGAGAAGMLLLVGTRLRAATSAARATQALFAVVLPAAGLLASSAALRAGAGGGLAALLGTSPWYANISEFRPMLTLGSAPLLADLRDVLGSQGLLLAACAAALPGARAAWSGGKGRARTLAVWAPLAVFLLAALMRRRFAGYLVVAAALPAEAGIRWVAASLSRRSRTVRRHVHGAALAAALITVAPTAHVLASGPAPLPPEVATAIETFLQARGLAPPPAREAVLAPWALGHLVQYYWSRPVVVSPFGVDGGDGALEAWGRFFFSTGAGEAEAALAERRVAWVVLENPADAADGLLPFAPAGTRPAFTVTQDLFEGRTATATPAFWELVSTRLYFDDGRGVAGGEPPLSGFRLELESPATAPEHPERERQLKVFGVVPGAAVVVAGAAPGRAVRATTRVRTNVGRTFSFSVEHRSAEAGEVTLRLPYATGPNGRCRAEAWTVGDGEHSVSLIVDERDVLTGRRIEVTLPALDASDRPRRR